MEWEREGAAPEAEIVRAAQRGDKQAREALVRRCLPLVYSIVSRAGSVQRGAVDVDDIVQEVMLQVVRDLGTLRKPRSLRAWVARIAVHQLASQRRRAAETIGPTAPPTAAEPVADFDELAMTHLQLSDQRREVARASCWLDADDRLVLSVWWLEAAGEMSRGELAAALGASPAYAAVRVQRMRARLDLCRSVVAALAAAQCGELASVAAGWDGAPGARWRKRFGRHVRGCPICLAASGDRIPAEQLLVGYGLVPVPAVLTAAVLGKSGVGAGAGGGAAVAKVGRGGRRAVRAVQSHPGTVVASAAALVAATVTAAAVLPDRPQTSSHPVAPSATPSVTSTSPTPKRSPSSPPESSSTPAPTRSHSSTASPAPSKEQGARLAEGWASWPMPNAGSAAPVNPARYRNLGDGTVRDEVTSLLWQRTPAPGTFTFTEATAYCADLELSGGGWHLPSRIELTSLVDTARVAPAIDTAAFPETPAEFFWTSSRWTVEASEPRAWIVNFYEGLASNAAFKSGSFQARCVRSPGGSGRPAYRVAAQQVTDPATGLTWQRATSGTSMTAAEADAYCSALELGGHAWRLPSVKELATTVDESRVEPAVDPSAFPRTEREAWYWSADAAAPARSARWALNYEDGYTDYRDVTTGVVRCVR